MTTPQQPPINLESPEEFIRTSDVVFETARKVVESGAEVLPVAFALTESKTLALAGIAFQGDARHRAEMVYMAGRTMADANPQAVAILVDASMKVAQPEEAEQLRASGESIHDMPGAIETLLLAKGTRDGARALTFLAYERDVMHGTVTFKDPQEVEGQTMGFVDAFFKGVEDGPVQDDEANESGISIRQIEPDTFNLDGEVPIN